MSAGHGKTLFVVSDLMDNTSTNKPPAYGTTTNKKARYLHATLGFRSIDQYIAERT
jgi:hypothetical protein